MKINKFGVGADIESIRRFKKIDRDNNRLFLDKIFTKNEIEHCFSKEDAAPHLAARFSVKDAVYNALCAIGKTNLHFSSEQ